MKKIQSTLTGALALILGFTFVFTAPTYALGDDDKDAGKKESKKDDDKSEDAEEEEDKDEWFAILGGDVYTGTGAILRGATVLSKNGVIEELGFDVELPEETETVNATGMRVYPGLVAMSATSRISRGMFAAQSDDEQVDTSQIDETEADAEEQPEAIDWLARAFDATIRGTRADDDEGSVGRRPKRMGIEDGFDPFNPYLVLALSAGITTCEQSGASVKLKRGTIEGVGMSEKYMSSFSWSNNSPSGKGKTREKFSKASTYLREFRDWEIAADKEVKEPSKKGVDTNALRVLRGEVWARFNLNTRDELFNVARLAQRFNFRPVIYGAREGWTVAGELGRAGAHIVLTPRTRSDKDEQYARAGGSSIENAAKLHQAGCTITVVPASTSIDLSGIAGRDLLHLPIEAAFAVRGGLTDEEALASITINPARLMGIDHRVGSLEIGKDCDLIITDGDVLHYESFVQWAVVAGKVSYDKQVETYFAHIRPRVEIVDPVDLPDEEVEDHDETEEEVIEEEIGDHDETEEEVIEEEVEDHDETEEEVEEVVEEEVPVDDIR